MRTCTVPDCDRKHLAKGLCRAHYLRMYKRGSVEPLVLRGVGAVNRILAKCVRNEKGCLVYTGRLTKKGYAHVRDDNGKMRFAHVIMYEREHGPVPDGLELDHLCRTRACCEEQHLEPVTHAVNVQRSRAGHDHESRPRNSLGQFASEAPR